MPVGKLSRVLQHIRHIAGARPGQETTDTALLEQFVRDRDEQAFATLVQRHGPLVLGVCRRLLTDGQDAEEAFQATFVVLARQAKSIGRGEVLASWLYRVAYNTAMNARKRAGQRVAS